MGMGHGEDAKDLIHKSLTNGLHAFKVEDDCFELSGRFGHPFGLRSGNEFTAELRQAHGNFGGVKSVCAHLARLEVIQVHIADVALGLYA